MLPDVVYQCRPGRNEELRYSLRSLRNVPHNRVFIFGDAPDWLNPRTVKLITTPQTGNPYLATLGSLHAACSHPDVSDTFYLFNDDFYITQPVAEIPLMHRGPIAAVIAECRARDADPMYLAAMNRAAVLVRSLGFREPQSYELHVPIPLVKQPMLATLRLKDHERYQWRTIYGNLTRQPAEQITDVKVYHPTDSLPAGPYLSTSDVSMRHFIHTLHEMFPDPCQYEFDPRSPHG